MKLLSFFLKNILSLIPFRLARIPYTWTYYLALWGIGVSRSSLWPRNSYYFQRIVMLVSDLDLTLLIKKGNSLSHKTKNRVFRAQKLLPLMGELNIVHEEIVTKYASLLPTLELQRDPILLRTLQLSLREAEEGEKFFFLWRMLWSDRKNLRVDPQMRKKKWIFHLESLQLDSNLFLEAADLGEFLESLDSKFECSMGYLQQLALQNEKSISFMRDELKLVFFLSDWLGDIYQNQRWENEENWPVLGPKLHHILKFSLSWEVWGVLSQSELQTHLTEFYTHIIGLKKISSLYSYECFLPALLEVEGLVLERMALSAE